MQRDENQLLSDKEKVCDRALPNKRLRMTTDFAGPKENIVPSTQSTSTNIEAAPPQPSSQAQIPSEMATRTASVCDLLPLS